MFNLNKIKMTNEQFDKAKMLTRHNKMLCILLKRNRNCPEIATSLVGLCNENENFKKSLILWSRSI